MPFRVLFIYPNLSMSSMVPHSIAVLSAVLKKNGMETDVFDTTFYPDQTIDTNQDKVSVLNVLPYSFQERGIKQKETNVYSDLRDKLNRFQPNLVAISFVEDNYALGSKLLESIRDFDIPVVAGGVFCTYAADKVVKNPNIDYVIRGEGEKALTDLCQALENCRNPYNINNLCYLKNGELICNPINALVDIDDLPFPDYSIFDEQNMYRPMTGKVYRTLAVELHRGCPFSCGYCNSAANNRWYLEHTNRMFFRKRNLDKFAAEFDFLIKKYKPEFIYFLSDTFLMLTDEEFDRFCEIYSNYKIPFFMNTRAETVTERRVAKLNEINCHRGNIGIEHGNANFRYNVIGRKIPDKTIIQAIKMVGESRISTAANNIIGFPGETRELVFDTINFNRQVERYCDSISCTVFAPYHGTLLREKAIQEGYLHSDVIVDTACISRSLLDMPQLSKAEIAGLQRTFSLYVRLPIAEWPAVKFAEELTPQGDKIFGALAKQFRERQE